MLDGGSRVRQGRRREAAVVARRGTSPERTRAAAIELQDEDDVLDTTSRSLDTNIHKIIVNQTTGTVRSARSRWCAVGRDRRTRRSIGEGVSSVDRVGCEFDQCTHIASGAFGKLHYYVSDTK
jgi:hypothetical protein